jgi:tetratricopeptide (TPR) repeat protein
LCVVGAALAVCLCSCRSPEQAASAVPAEQIEALLEQKLEARALVEQALALAGQAEEQKQLYLLALELDPSLGEASNNLGLIYLEAEHYPDAIGMLREAVKRMPGSPAPRHGIWTRIDTDNDGWGLQKANERHSTGGLDH